MDRIKILLEQRQELVVEEKFLKKLQTEIEEQINVLQVEQFHLSGIVNKSIQKTPDHKQEYTMEIEELDLHVPSIRKDSEEEEEDD